MEISSRYNNPRTKPFRFEQNTMTQQQYRDECDINNIIARYNTTGELPQPISTIMPSYGDFTQISDFAEAQTIIAHAQQAFDQLPSSLRKRFENDPNQLIHFMEKEENYDEAVNLGLVQRRISETNPSTSTGDTGNATATTQAASTGAGPKVE